MVLFQAIAAQKRVAFANLNGLDRARPSHLDETVALVVISSQLPPES